MEKMNELSKTISDLRSVASAIESIADWLAESISAPEKPALTLEEVRATLAEKSRNGHTAQVRELLRKYGATKLSEVDPQNYEALIRDAEVLADAT